MFSPFEYFGLRLVEPAPFSAVLEMGGKRPRLRRALLGQRVGNDSAAVYDMAGALLCVFMIKQWRARRVELAFMVKRAVAARRMLTVLRLARVMLFQIVARGILVFAHISPLNEAGQRMAAIAGFERGKFKDRSIWIFRQKG